MKHEYTLARVRPGSGSIGNVSGQWQNELGSTVTFVQNGSILTGTYESAVSGGGSATSGQVQGYVTEGLISFIVLWDSVAAITAWVGQIQPSATSMPSFDTLWQMTQQVGPGEEWAAINAGADTFVRCS